MILLGNQGWLAREEGPKGSSQELTDIKSYSSRLWGMPTSIVSFKSLSNKKINMEAVLFAYFMLLGKS